MEPLWEAFNMLFFLLETSLICIMTIMRHGPLGTMPILRHDYFTTATIMRQALFATSLLWDMSFILQQPLWDLTILRHDIFPTTTIMKDYHLETRFFSYYIIWSEKKYIHFWCAKSAIIIKGYLFTKYYDLFETWSLCKIDLLRRNHFEIWTICNNNLFETWQWHYWDSIRLQQ